MANGQPNATMMDGSRRQQIGYGFELLRQGRLADAARLSDSLVAAHGDNAEALYLAAQVKLSQGEADAAFGFIAAAADAAPDQIALQVEKANVLLLLRRRKEARQVASSIAATAGNDAQALWAAGTLYSKCNAPEIARGYYEKALARVDNPALSYDLAVAQFFMGDFAGAERGLEKVLASAPKAGHAIYLRSTLRRQTDASNHVEDLQARLAGGFPDDAGQAACLYALAKELEDLGETDRSFSTLTEAARLKRRTLQYAAAAERASIDAIRETYTAEVMNTNAPGHAEEGPIFVVGMPRTGTTLVERMLGRHSDVASAGELLDFGQALAAAARKYLQEEPGKTLVEATARMDFAALGRDYLSGVRQMVPDARMFIDKMPVNFMYCGMIKKALPNARIIHVVRDPMDSCYAIYKTLFNQAYSFSYDLGELADYYITYHRLMRHWHAVMPGAILDVSYEALVADTEAQARRILDWCGLDWQDAVLAPSQNDQPSTTASAAQVREPIYASSVQKWRKYEMGLAPLKARLVEAGIVDA